MKKKNKKVKIQNNGPFKLPPYKVENVIATLSQLQDWGIKQSNVPETWKITKGEDIVVAVLDTGYSDHVDLRGAFLTDKCISTIDNNINDRQFHSTHCCGILGARDNDVGVVGYSPECKIITVKVLGDDGSGSFDAIVKGLEYALKMKVDLVSMSLGASSGSEELHNAIKKLYDANIPLLVAAGNDGIGSPVNYPAVYPECIAVSAFNKNMDIANFSCTGKEVFISGAGVDIYSTYKNNTYAKLSGTSMATPAVAGIVTLLLAKHKKQERETGQNDCKTVDQVKEHLKKYAINMDKMGRDDKWGWGYLDSLKLIEEKNIDDPISKPIHPIITPPKSLWQRFGTFWKRLFDSL